MGESSHDNSFSNSKAPRLTNLSRSRASDVPFTCFRLGLGLASRRPSEWSLRHSTVYLHPATVTSFTNHANRVLCVPSRPRYFHGPCASLTVILSLVISALLRPLPILLLLTHLFECLGHPHGSHTAHGCLCINSSPQQSSPRSMIGTSLSAPLRIALQRY
jgi:hypothetical protein